MSEDRKRKQKTEAVDAGLERVEVIRCPICSGVNEHSLSCPSRWYSDTPTSAYGFDLDNGATRIEREVRAAFGADNG